MTRQTTVPLRLLLPASTASPTLRSKGRDSPLSKASSTSVLPDSITPSAANTSPALTRMRSPTASQRAAMRSLVSSGRQRSTLGGMRLISASKAPAVRSRKRSSKARPLSRKNTNMVSESKYTVAPNRLSRSKVPQLLVTKVRAMPMATGTSIPMRRARTSRQALSKYGLHENTKTGRVSTQDAQRRSCSISGVTSPAVEK